jgi:hypothetical protein
MSHHKLGREVWFGPVTSDTTYNQLHDLFSEAGEIEKLTRGLTPKTRQPAEWGFCLYVDKDSANFAVKFIHGRHLNEQRINVRISDDAWRAEEVQKLRDIEKWVPPPPQRPSPPPETASPPPAPPAPERPINLMVAMATFQEHVRKRWDKYSIDRKCEILDLWESVCTGKLKVVKGDQS